MEYQKYFTNYEDYKTSSSLFRTIYSLRDVSPLQAKMLVKYNMVNVISNGGDGYYLEPTGKFTYLSNMNRGVNKLDNINDLISKPLSVRLEINRYNKTGKF